jgi:serine/threonine-protein kinase
MVGRVIDGRYRVERVLGEGGMGVVFLITHVALNKRMAMKVLREEMAREHDVVQRFIQEAQASTAIGHPNIVDISDFGRTPEGAVYFVMEHLEGETLTERIERKGPLGVAEAVAIAEQIASALAAAHAHGVIHRDMKPDNVFLLRRGDRGDLVKVLDFGIAKVGSAPSKLTRTGMVFGTPHYMAPEQAAGQVVDARADIYALGVILYEMFTGVVPFDAETFMGVLTKQMFEEPVPPTERGATPDMGPLEPIVLRALAKKPEGRYATMDALLRDLDAVRRGGRSLVAATPAPTARGATGAEVAFTPREPSGAPAAPRPRVGLYAAIAACVLLAAGSGVGAVYVIWRRADARTSPPAIALPRRPEASTLDLPPARPSAEPRPVASGSAPAAATPEPASAAAAPPVAVTSPIQATVRLTSGPDRAVVLVDGAIVGQTPIALPASLASSAHAIVLRHGGYEERRIEAAQLVTGEDLHVELEPQARGRRRGVRPPAEVAAAPAPEPPAAASVMTRRRFSEVVDPWD